MKINSTTAYFKYNLNPLCKFKSIDDVPFWAIYDKNMIRVGTYTLTELKEVTLQPNFPKFVVAYARKSRKINNRFDISIDKIDSRVDIVNIKTGEILATYSYIAHYGCANPYVAYKCKYIVPTFKAYKSYFTALAVSTSWKLYGLPNKII